MIVLIPMAGSDDAFREKGYAHIKPLVEVHGKPIVQHVWENLSALGARRHIFVIRKDDAVRHRLADVLRLMDPESAIVQTENATRGAACTALLGIQYISADEELIITNGDQIIESDLKVAIEDFRDRKLDGGAIVFDSVHPRWSFVRLGSDRLVIEAAEKRPISRMATAGFYYFRRGGDFVRAAMNMIRKDANVNGAFFVCPAFNELILEHAAVGVHEIQRSAYRSLGTPQDVEQFDAYLTGLGR